MFEIEVLSLINNKMPFLKMFFFTLKIKRDQFLHFISLNILIKPVPILFFVKHQKTLLTKNQNK